MVPELYHNKTVTETHTRAQNLPRALECADGPTGLVRAALGKERLRGSPRAVELCLLVAAVVAGLWALQAVKLKAAAQQSLLPRACVCLRPRPDGEEGISQGSFGEQDKGTWGLPRPEDLHVALQRTEEVPEKLLGCSSSWKSEDGANCVFYQISAGGPHGF